MSRGSRTRSGRNRHARRRRLWRQRFPRMTKRELFDLLTRCVRRALNAALARWTVNGLGGRIPTASETVPEETKREIWQEIERSLERAMPAIDTRTVP